MRIHSVTILCILIGTELFSQSPIIRHPALNEAQEHFYRTWKLESTIDQVRFERRPSGWSVSLMRSSNTIGERQIWESRRQKWTKPSKREALGRNDIPYQRRKAPPLMWPAGIDEACVYYGYDGWSLDVIDALHDKDDLPASLKYGLARAYGDAASNRLWANYGLEARGYQWDLPTGPNCLDTNQLQEFRTLTQHALDLYDQVSRSDPGYSTVVGEIGLKRDNEYVDRYLKLAIFQNETEGLRDLPSDLYSPFYRSMARAYLSSCEEDAILFTNGDTDTFPLLYVQAVEAFRPDILVVNLSLLNTARYISFLRRESTSGARPLPLTTPDSIWYSPKCDVGITNKDATVPFDIAELSRLLEAGRTTTGYAEQYLDIPSDKFRIDGPAGSTAVEWDNTQGYLLRNALACFDMLATNKWSRPVYWAVTTDPKAFFGLQEHFELKGFAYRLTPTRSEPVDTYGPGRIDPERSMRTFTTAFSEEIPDSLPEAAKKISTGLVLQLGRVAGQFLAQGDTTTALSLLDEWTPKFNYRNVSSYRIMLVIIEAYYRAGHNEKAGDLGRSLAIRTLESAHSPDGESKEIRHAVLERLKTWAIDHQQWDRAGEIERFMERL